MTFLLALFYVKKYDTYGSAEVPEYDTSLSTHNNNIRNIR